MKVIYKRIIILILICLIGIQFILLFGLEPIGYNIDIYSQIPFIFYLLNFLSYFILIFIISNYNFFSFKYSIFLILLLFLNSLFLLIIPFMLGYYTTDRGDSFLSLGFLRYILSNGNLDPLDFYPIVFIESSIVQYITNINIMKITYVIPIISSLIFTLTLFTSMKIIIKSYNKHYSEKFNFLAIGLAIPFYLGEYHSSFIAHSIIFSLDGFFFLSLYHFTKIKSNSNLIMTYIFSILTIIGHPIIGAFNCILLIIYSLYEHIIKNNNRVFNRLVISLFIFMMVWFLYIGLIKQAINMIIFVNDYKFTIMNQINDLAIRGNISISELLIYGIFRYGDQLMIYIAFILISFSLVNKKMSITNIYIFCKESILKIKGNKFLSLGLIVSIIVTLGLLVFPLIRHSYDRIIGLNIGIYFITLYIAVKFTKTKSKLKYIFFLVIIYIISVQGLFISPLVGLPNIGISYNEVAGIEFMFSFKDPNYKIIDLIGESKRYSVWYYGYTETFKRDEVLYLQRLPNHFGYMNISYIKDNEYIITIEHNVNKEKIIFYNYTKMLIPVTTFMYLPYDKIHSYKSVNAWSAKDILQIANDPSTNKIYVSYDLSLFQIP